MVSTFSRKDQNYKNEDLNQPSKEGRFGKYGGQYVPETLMPALFELETAASNAVSYTHLTLPTTPYV